MTSPTSPFTVFHLTTADVLPDILTQGLVPQIGARSEAAAEPTPRVYFFDSQVALEDAATNWLGDEFPEDAPLVAIRADITGLNAQREGFEVQVSEVVPPERLEIIELEF